MAPGIAPPAFERQASAHRLQRSFSAAAAADPKPVILATTSVFPPNEHSQDDYLQRFLDTHVLTPEDEDFVRRVFKATMIEAAQSYLPRDKLFHKMSRSEYVAYVRPSLLDLGLRAARDVIAQWGGPVSEITHVVWGTMTGTIHAPTLDILIARKLGLSPNVKRLSVENMGCLTGFRCLNLASEIASSGDNKLVLVIVCDIRSALQNQMPHHEANAPIDRSDVVVTSLFRDSGGAALVASPLKAADAAAQRLRIAADPAAAAEGVAAAGGERCAPLYEVLAGRSYIVPDSGHMVDYHEGDDATIKLHIAKELPDAVKGALPGLVDELLAESKVALRDCCFAIHTGGPKVIKNCAAALGVPPEVMGASWHVMKKHGNLSGSSNLVVLDHLRRLAAAGAEGVEEKEYCVCVSMGPGVCVEAVLLRRFGWREMQGVVAKRTSTALTIPELDEAALALAPMVLS